MPHRLNINFAVFQPSYVRRLLFLLLKRRIMKLSAWLSGYGRAPPEFLHHESGGPGSIPRAGTVNQLAVHPSVVGKLVAISGQVGDRC